jgi:hypothetical protein
VLTAEGVFDGLDADDSRRVAAQVAFDFLTYAPAAAEAVAIMDRALRCGLASTASTGLIARLQR